MALSGCLGTAGANRCTKGTILKIYLNNGTSLVESSQWQQNLTGVGWGSTSFGDLDNDGDLDLALTGCTNASDNGGECYGQIISKIYINNGTSLVESSQWQSNLTAVFDSSTALGDMNNDGKLDLIIIGGKPTLPFYNSKIYINNGTSLVESSQWQSNLTGVYQGNIALGDMDNDGDLDLALTGNDGNNRISKIYINNGTSLTENSIWSQNLLGVSLSSLTLADFDNDGDIDIDLTGQISGDHHYIYSNNKSSLVENQSKLDQLIGIYRSSVAFGDIDNDGDLDLGAIGNEHGYARVYENNNSYFVQDAIAHANISDDFYQGSLAWSDLDNDADLDLIISGLDFTTTEVSKIYISNASLTKNNTKSNPPNSSFSANYINNILTLSWGNGSDAETNTSGLYYNLMVGNSTKNSTIVSGIYGGSSGGAGGAGAGAAGYFGNMMQRKNIALNVQLEANKTYYWAVQTIDTGLAKSNWSAMQNFTTAIDVTKPNVTINEPSPNESLHTTNPYFIFNISVTDANLTNVTLYANFNGTMLANETNSSGINGTYTFIRNLTNYNDSQYSWYIYACDGTNNCQTLGRSFYLDRSYPIVRAISPANSASWTSSSIVTFSYNISDVDIANCSLSINNVVVNTSTSVNEDVSQEFTYSLSNGNYNWNINCTDYVGYTNSSSIYSLTVNYVVPTSAAGRGGGGTASTTPKTYAATDEQLLQGYTQILSKDDKIKFSINNKNHSLLVNSVNEILNYANLTLNSTPFNFLIYVNETKKFELTNDNFYDLLVKLNNLVENKANLTIKSIYEKIPAETEEKETGKEVSEEEKKEEKPLDVKKYLVFLVISIIIIVILIIYSKKYLKYKSWKKWTLLG